MGIWVAALIIGCLSILLHYFPVKDLSKYNYEMLLIGFVLLIIGTAYRKL